MSMKDLFFHTALTVKDRKPDLWLIDLAGAVEPLHSTAGSLHIPWHSKFSSQVICVRSGKEI